MWENGDLRNSVISGQLSGLNDKLEFEELKKKCVIASQCAHWRGNPLDFQDTIIGQFPFLPAFKEELGLFWLPEEPGDCHTSLRTGSQ